MCLQIIACIAADAKSRISAERLSELTGLSIGKSKFGGEPALIFSVTGGCSCEFLSDDAEFENSEWLLASDNLPALANAVSILGRECKKFSFVAHWLNSERPKSSQSISASKLAALVTENKVGNNVQYNVG